MSVLSISGPTYLFRFSSICLVVVVGFNMMICIAVNSIIFSFYFLLCVGGGLCSFSEQQASVQFG